MVKKPVKYSPELRAEVVAAYEQGGRTYAEVARNYNLVPETVRLWVAAAKKENSGQTPEARDSIERARVAEMERRIRELESENAFLKKAAAFFAREQR